MITKKYESTGLVSKNRRLALPLFLCLIFCVLVIPALSYAECEYIIHNGSPETKLDVAFIPMGFSTIDDFNSLVMEHIDANKLHKGLLYFDPFDKDRNKFNFLKTDTLPSEIEADFYRRNCQYGNSEHVFACIADIKNWLSSNNCIYDKALIIHNNVPPNTGGGWAEALNGSIALTIADVYPPFESQGLIETVHELGHLLGLTDEAIGGSEFKGYGYSLQDVPNCDTTGCSKWCGDYIKEPSGAFYLLCRDLSEGECKNNVNCVWRNVVDEFFKTQCVPLVDHINIGVDCLEGTGCYYNCNGTGAWRPADYTDYFGGELIPTSMMFYMMNALGFDSVDKRHLGAVLSSYDDSSLSHPVSGKVTLLNGDIPVSNATVTITGEGLTDINTETDVDGRYQFTNLVNGTYTIVPMKSGHTFAPTERVVTVYGAEETNKDFSGTLLTYTLSLYSSGNGAVRVNGTLHTLPWSGQFPAGTNIQLEAVPDNGWRFSAWSGDVAGSAALIIINMNSNKTVIAAFQTETLPPVGSIVINGGAEATKSTSATLTLAASDDSGNPIQMCISNSTSCATYSWTAFTATKSWTLGYGNGNKIVYVWFRDRWGNVNPSPYSDTILIDTTAPTNGIVTGTPGNTQVTLNWSGFSDAASGVESYKVVYSTGSYAPYSCSTGTSIYIGPDTSFIHTGRTNGTTYSYRVCAIDKAGNISSGAARSVKPVPETNTPAGSIIINGGAEAAKSASVTLTLTASDDSGSPMQMCISNTTSCPAYSWTSFIPTKKWTLSYGNGIKAVHVWFRDRWGNTNPTPYSDTILIDTKAPTNGTVTATPGDTQVTLNWSGFSDAQSGIETYKVVFSTSSYAPYSCSSGTSPYTGPDTSFIHTGRTNGTTYSYRICALDKAGNMSSGATRSVKPVGP